MHKCEDCKVILDNDVRYCPKCGRSVGDHSRGRGPGDVEVGALLTSANLHRIRGEWDEAINDATEALKLDSSNADIASLLGNIYEQRDMLDDAAIWYQMAVELDPASSADSVRLQRVKDRIAGSGGDSFRTFQRRTKIWAVAMGAAFLLVVGLALFAMLGRSGTGAPPPEKEAGPVKPPPIQATPGAPTTPPTDRPPPESAGARADSSASPPVRTSGELAISNELENSTAVHENRATIDDVIADPREGIAVVTFSIPTTPTVTRGQVIEAAAAVAQTVFAANAEVKFVTARCVIKPTGSTGAQIGFVGDAARSTVEAWGKDPTQEKLLAAFTRQWWNPQITP